MGKPLSGAMIVLIFCAIPWRLSQASGTNKHWVTAYFPAWEVGDGTNSTPPLSAVDFTSMTAVAYFGFLPYPNGGIDTSDNINYKGSRALVNAAHAAGTVVTMSIGGWQSESRFQAATSPENLATFVGNIATVVKEYNYDGVDLDWEPLSPGDFVQFERLTKALRVALPHPYLLTVATGQGAENLMAELYPYFDEINLMTYDLSFPSQGWVTWYNSAVYDKGITVGWSKPVPSCSSIVRNFINAGVPASKLGIGAELAGAVWQGGEMTDGHGVRGPDEKWITPPSVRFDVPLYWHDGTGIMQRYYKPEYRHWDGGAQVPYLSIPGSKNSEDMFVSYDDSASIAAKAGFIERSNLGGLILYELGWAYPGNGKYPLLQVVKKSFGRELEHPWNPDAELVNGNR